MNVTKTHFRQNYFLSNKRFGVTKHFDSDEKDVFFTFGVSFINQPVSYLKKFIFL